MLVSWLAGTPGSAQQGWHKAYFPNVELVTQDGKKVRFYDDVIKDKVVAINFIYTKCPDVCPLDTAALRRVQKLVGDRMGRDVFFYSISLDPKNDTPAALKKYMKTFDVGPGWTFLTGRPQDLALIQSKFGIKPVSAGMLTAHDTRYVLGNESIARWLKRTPHDNPHVLAHILTNDLASPGMARDAKPRRSYAEAKRIEGMTRGGDAVHDAAAAPATRSAAATARSAPTSPGSSNGARARGSIAGSRSPTACSPKRIRRRWRC